MSNSLRNSMTKPPIASDYGPLDGDFDPFDDDEAVEDLVTFE
jgi:hypothetical protein